MHSCYRNSLVSDISIATLFMIRGRPENEFANRGLELSMTRCGEGMVWGRRDAVNRYDAKLGGRETKSDLSVERFTSSFCLHLSACLRLLHCVVTLTVLCLRIPGGGFFRSERDKA